MQTIQTPEEDAPPSPQQLIPPETDHHWPAGLSLVISTISRSERAVGLVVQGGERTVSEAEKTHTELTLIALDAFALHVISCTQRVTMVDIIGLRQGAPYHIVIHHGELVFQVCWLNLICSPPSGCWWVFMLSPSRERMTRPMRLLPSPPLPMSMSIFAPWW